MHQEILDFVIQTVKATAKIQLDFFRSNNLGIVEKSNVNDIVTRADKQSEAFIIQSIVEKYPHHRILGEENGFNGAEESDYLWVIDPLDGTTNFSQGIPVFTISVALQYKGETLIGVVYAPYLDELFTAIKGEGAYVTLREDKRLALHITNKTLLENSVVGTGFPYDKHINPDNNSRNVVSVLPRVRDIRRLGSAAYDLCCVAGGYLDAYWEMSLNLWDVCAGILIVEEAGGVVQSFRKDRNISIVAGNVALVTALKPCIQ